MILTYFYSIFYSQTPHFSFRSAENISSPIEQVEDANGEQQETAEPTEAEPIVKTLDQFLAESGSRKATTAPVRRANEVKS